MYVSTKRHSFASGGRAEKLEVLIFSLSFFVDEHLTDEKKIGRILVFADLDNN